MITKERLLALPELNLAGKVEQMTDMQFGYYVTSLNTFIDRIPSIADDMKSTLSTKAYSALSIQLKNAGNTLDKLHANNLAGQCRKLMGKIDNPGPAGVDHDETEAAVENLIQNISALSIEIQMSGHKPKPKSSAAGAAPAPVRRSNRPLILAVDNAIMFLNTLKKMLKDAPYEVHSLTSCDEALDYLQSNKPDMFLLDIEMPDMDGYELASRIKSSGQKAPIIFITANSAREYVDKAVDVGAVGLLMKPLRVNQLLEKIKEFI